MRAEEGRPMASDSKTGRSSRKRASASGRFVSNAERARWPGKSNIERANDSSGSGRGASAGQKPVTARSDSQPAGSDPITAEQRASAARIRIAYDKKRGRDTEAWIRELAG
jgi:hypothetical protein